MKVGFLHKNETNLLIRLFFLKKKIILSNFVSQCISNHKEFLKENLKHTNIESKKILCLPSSTFLKKKDTDYILNSIDIFSKLIR